MYYALRSMRRTSASSALQIKALWRRLRLRFGLFLVRMWRAYALLRRIFPLPVRRKRFAAPRCVFNLGMVPRLLVTSLDERACATAQTVSLLFGRHGRD